MNVPGSEGSRIECLPLAAIFLFPGRGGQVTVVVAPKSRIYHLTEGLAPTCPPND